MILNIYKEKGWTSFDVVAKLRSQLKIKKIGHAGTLDPLAEGVLVVLTQIDTKKQNDIMKMKKEYLAKIALGVSSPSYDLETEIIEGDTDLAGKLKLEEIKQALKKYTGVFEQTVPAYSATKFKGKRLYELARKGEVNEEDLPKKEVEIIDMVIDSYEKESVGGFEVPVLTLRITCSKGFYVRSLAHDVGKDLKVGGLLAGLVRTKVGDYRVEDAKKVEEIRDL